MTAVTLIFPHQLFRQHPAVKKERKVWLIEESLFFNQYNFHRQKIILHRASMRAYADYLQAQGIAVNYVEAVTNISDIRLLLKQLHMTLVTTIHFADVADNWLNRRITETCTDLGMEMTEYDTPNFLNTMSGIKDYFDSKKTYFQTDFYIAQRKQRRILLDADGLPEGGKWSFDAENRLKFPSKAVAPAVLFPKENSYVQEARTYVENNFKANPGEADTFIYPVDFETAEKWLETFLRERFEDFGKYEDAIVANEHFLHHSVLSPMLNTGLLSPQQVIDRAMAAAVTYRVPLNSLEGFIRQIMGWREFIRIVYEREGSRQRTNNFWGFTRNIPASFRAGNTGILPVDNVIGKVLRRGYCHHIERLMVMGNFMLLCEFDPDEVYRWFMEMFIDAYDWVMVPNVYGMTQFADGGLMTTKPYISGSNYLLKMSNYKKGGWADTWDGLFWRFMHVHRDFLVKNPRLGILINTFDKMPPEKREQHLQNGENYLAKLDRESSGR